MPEIAAGSITAAVFSPGPGLSFLHRPIEDF